MNVSLSWLAEHLDLSDHSLQQIDDLLTFAGVEVEGIQRSGVPSDKIVVAQIKEAVQHPDADKLKVCQVDAGEPELRQIVCGAKNYQVGDKVPCCLPGADLGGFVIGEAKMRGVESKGMLAGAGEIGLVDQEDGLMILPADSVIGTPLVEIYPPETLIEVEVTPNRPDLLSHYGMARELGALIDRKPEELVKELPATTEAGEFITLDGEGRCPLYSAVRIRGVKVTDSPEWLQAKLTSIGLRPINNVVDITNYVLHELGHPLHAFDAAKVDGGIVVRTAADGEKFKTLDEQDLTLRGSDLLIADSSGTALALAGVMGGLDSGVTESTTDIILESAWFEPKGIRQSARNFNLSTDSSYRFERGADPQAVLKASALATKLIIEIAGGSAEAEVLVAGEAPSLTPPVILDRERLFQMMGDDITLEEAESILTRLGLRRIEAREWAIPSFRQDLQRHIDLMEEIARVHGLDKVTSRHVGAYVPSSASDAAYDFQLNLKRKLAALGFYETQTIKLISKDDSDSPIAQLQDALPLRPLMDGDLIEVSLPLSEEHSVMRPSLTPGLVASATRNARQGSKALRFFEIGRQFRNAGGGKAKDIESDSLALFLAGETAPMTWANKQPRATDLFDLKASIAQLLPKAQIQFKPRDRDGFILAGDVIADGSPIGAYAQLHPQRCRDMDLPKASYIAELDAAKLQKLATKAHKAQALPQFPSSTRDAAMEAPSTLENAKIEQAIAKHSEKLLVESFCFDVFADPSGEKLAADKKSIAYRFVYRSPDTTLEQKQVDEAHEKLLAHLKKALQIEYR